MKLCAVYLASPREWKHLEWLRIDCLYASLALLEKHMPPMPVIVFHEDYTEEDMDWLDGAYPQINYHKIDFSGHEAEFNSVHPTERVGSYGYACMCRFWGGQVQHHFALSDFTHYMRLDDDSYIVREVTPGMLAKMTGWDYVYRDKYQDANRSLWPYAMEFLKKHRIQSFGQFNTALPYNNFHVSSLAMWRHPLVLEFLRMIDEAQGIFKQGWHDTHIHQIIIEHLAPAIGATVNTLPEFSYRHNQQCCHPGPHTPYCYDGTREHFQWGPPTSI